LKLVKQIRDEKFDLLVSNFHGATFRSVTLFSNIPYRAGHCTSPGWKNPSDFLYNIKVRMEECEHEVDRDLRLAKAIGIKDTDDSPMFHVSKKDRVSANNFLQQNDIRDGDLTVGIQIGTWHVQEWKRWDITKLALVCDRLIEDYGARVIVLGAPQHLKELETLLGSIKHEIVIALGKTTIKQSAAIVERCDFTICNDSGLMHITAAMGTPVIAIYGPTDYHRTSPCRYGELHIVIRKELECSPCFRMAGDEDNVISCPHRNCLESITVEDVLIAVKKVLAQKPKPLQK
jgi:ADP-heptose:LPS heptosyltransferase